MKHLVLVSSRDIYGTITISVVANVRKKAIRPYQGSLILCLFKLNPWLSSIICCISPLESDYLLVDIYHGNTCTTKLYVFVAEMAHIGDGAKVLTDELAQYAGACAVKDTHARHTY